MCYEITVGDVKPEQRTICCPDTVINTPMKTVKQRNLYTVLVIHSSCLPYNNINTYLFDGPVYIFTLLKVT